MIHCSITFQKARSFFKAKGQKHVKNITEMIVHPLLLLSPIEVRLLAELPAQRHAVAQFPVHQHAAGLRGETQRAVTDTDTQHSLLPAFHLQHHSQQSLDSHEMCSITITHLLLLTEEPA